MWVTLSDDLSYSYVCLGILDLASITSRSNPLPGRTPVVAATRVDRAGEYQEYISIWKLKLPAASCRVYFFTGPDKESSYPLGSTRKQGCLRYRRLRGEIGCGIREKCKQAWATFCRARQTTRACHFSPLLGRPSSKTDLPHCAHQITS